MEGRGWGCLGRSEGGGEWEGIGWIGDKGRGGWGVGGGGGWLQRRRRVG